MAHLIRGTSGEAPMRIICSPIFGSLASGLQNVLLRAVAAACLLGLCGLLNAAQAGKMLYQQCFTARGDTADGFKASLQAGGLFYNGSGTRANEIVLGRFGQCEPSTVLPTPLFKGS